jgi:hypothetical protein
MNGVHYRKTAKKLKNDHISRMKLKEFEKNQLKRISDESEIILSAINQERFGEKRITDQNLKNSIK